MTAIFGTDTNYFNISDYHLYLTLTNDKEFNTDIPWDRYIDYIKYNKPLNCSITDPDISKRYNLPNDASSDTCLKQLKSIVKDEPSEHSWFTIYDALGMDPDLSKMKALVDRVGFKSLYAALSNGYITFFAPTNEFFDEVLGELFSMYDQLQIQKEILQYHTLDFQLDLWQMAHRKLRLKTMLPRQYIETDATKGKYQLDNNPKYNLNDWFPKKEYMIDIIGTTPTDNGMLMKIAKPLVFDLV